MCAFKGQGFICSEMKFLAHESLYFAIFKASPCNKVNQLHKENLYYSFGMSSLIRLIFLCF